MGPCLRSLGLELVAPAPRVTGRTARDMLEKSAMTTQRPRTRLFDGVGRHRLLRSRSPAASRSAQAGVFSPADSARPCVPTSRVSGVVRVVLEWCYSIVHCARQASTSATMEAGACGSDHLPRLNLWRTAGPVLCLPPTSWRSSSRNLASKGRSKQVMVVRACVCV
jgi:hypothetical protein